MKARTPEQVMREVTEDMMLRAQKLARRKRRTIYISKSARGKGTDVSMLDPGTPEGRSNLDTFLAKVNRIYTFHGLGAPEEPNAINWRRINLPTWRRILVSFQVGISFVMKGTPLKNRLYRWMGCHIGRNVEVMQMAWLDHYRPELIFIGDNTLVGAYAHITVHSYEGAGRFRYGLVEIGANCTIAAGTGIGPIRIEDNVRTLPGTTVSPYLTRIRAGSVVGFTPPPVRAPDTRDDILSTVNSYEMVESYPEDKYLPSYLILAGSRFHVLFAADIEGDNIRVITTYIPDPDEWNPDLKTRRSDK